MLPPFDENGFLPDGIHECCLPEAEGRFASFQTSDRRPRLRGDFLVFLEQVKAAGVVRAILLDGSFVSAKSNPNDIDLIMVLSATHDFRKELSPAEYNILSAQRAKRLHKLTSSWQRKTPINYDATSAFFNKFDWNPTEAKAW